MLGFTKIPTPTVSGLWRPLRLSSRVTVFLRARAALA
jgi:hypothetical protein